MTEQAVVQPVAPEVIVPAVLNQEPSPDKKAIVEAIRKQMQANESPAEILKSLPFRYNESPEMPEGKQKTLTNIDSLITKNIDKNSSKDLVAGWKKDSIAKLFESDLPSDFLVGEAIIEKLLQWPDLRHIYGVSDIHQLSPLRRRELIDAIKKMIKTPQFQEQLQKACDAMQATFGSADAKTQKEEQVRQFKAEQEQAKKAREEALSELISKNKEKKIVENDLVSFKDSKGDNFIELNERYPESHAQVDRKRLEMGEIVLKDKLKKITGSQDESEIILIKEEYHEKVKELDNLKEKLVARDALVQKLNSLEEQKKLLSSEINNKKIEIRANKTKEQNAKANIDKSKAELGAIEEKFIEALHAIPVVAVAGYMNELFELFKKAHEQVLKNFAEKAPDQSTAVIRKALTERWKNPELIGKKWIDLPEDPDDPEWLAQVKKFPKFLKKEWEEWKGAVPDDPEGSRMLHDFGNWLHNKGFFQSLQSLQSPLGLIEDLWNGKFIQGSLGSNEIPLIRVRNTKTDPITGKKIKIEGYHYEKADLIVGHNADKIKKDFDKVIAEKSVEGVLLDILQQGATEIPDLQSRMEQAERDARNSDIFDTDGMRIIVDIDAVKKVVAQKWYQEQPPEWRLTQEKSVIEELYREREKHCLKSSLSMKGLGPLPIPDHENEQYLEIIKNVYGGEDTLEKAVLEEAAKNPAAQKIVDELKKEAKDGENLLRVAKRKKIVGGLLAILLGTLMTLTDEFGK